MDQMALQKVAPNLCLQMGCGSGKAVKSQTIVTGVQPKLSLHLEKTSKKDEPQRFTTVGFWDNCLPPACTVGRVGRGMSGCERRNIVRIDI